MTLLDESPVAAASVPMSPRPLVPGSASTGRWRLAARLARRELCRRPWRTVLVALLVAAPVAGVALVDTAYRSQHLSTSSRELGVAAGRLDLMGVGADGADALAELVPDRFEQAAWYGAPVPLRSTGAIDDPVDADLVTLDAATPLGSSIVRVASGRAPVAPDEVLLAPDLARSFGVDVGDELSLVRPAQTFRVVGLGEVGTYPHTFLAPGFDVGVLRSSWLSMYVLLGREGVEGQSAEAISEWLAHVDPAEIASAGWGFTPRQPGERTEPITLFLGWLGATMLMGALGIVVGAAFAISGRRQLVTLGQLSATGADASVVHRFLALQGTWTGLAGASLGVGGAAAFVAAFGDNLRSDGGLDVRPLDWMALAVTAVVVATVAALLPARSLARVSTLTALGGRRPVPPVRSSQVRAGVGLLAGGVVGLTLAVVMARDANQTGGAFTGPLLLGIGAGGVFLAGVCFLGPVWVHGVARAGGWLGRSARLALRDLDRHRTRSGALLAAVMVVGAAAVAVGATVEQAHVDDMAARAYGAVRNDVFWVSAYNTSSGDPIDLDDEFPDARGQIEDAVGPVRWFAQRTALAGSGDDARVATIADPTMLELSGFSDDAIGAILRADVALVRPEQRLGYVDVPATLRAFGLPASTAVVEVTGTWLQDEIVFVSTEVAHAAGARIDLQWYGQTDHALTASDHELLTDLSSWGGYDEAAAFTGVEPDSRASGFSVGFGGAPRDWVGVARWATLHIALLLVLLVVGLGLALEAAEGRDDRDTLVAIGASPSTLASLVAWKAGLIALVGGVLAIPLGYGTLWLCVQAARRETTFPWVIAGGVALVVPIVVAALAWGVSRAGARRQRTVAARNASRVATASALAASAKSRPADA